MPKKKPQFTFVKLPGMSAAISVDIPRGAIENQLMKVQRRIAARRQKQLIAAPAAHN